MQQDRQLGFRFTGTGAEYFRIWIVNLFLTIITLGIYSAWAKVRRMQYFYRHTWLNESSFDFQGSPTAILKGRLIAVGMLVVYNVMLKVQPAVGLTVLLLIMLGMPWLLMKSFRFRLQYTSYRGLRFGFVGKVGSAYRCFLLWPILSAFTLYLLWPFAHQRIKHYQMDNSRFGQTQFSFGAPVGGFYKIYVLPFLLLLGLVGALVAVGINMAMQHRAGAAAPGKQAILFMILAVYAVFVALAVLVTPYFIARMQNLVWNNMRLGEHRFVSSVTARRMTWIVLTNLLGLVVTLGLFKPFADVRLARYRMENLALQPAGDMDAFVASAAPQVGALGLETAEMFDLDISF